MKVMILRKTVLLTIASLGLLLAPAAWAAHFTNFLETLETEVATRIENITDETTAQERRALTSASRTLARNTRSLGADLGVLAIAATALERGFPGDETLLGQESDAVNEYAAVAQARLDEIVARADGLPLPRSLSNQLTQAQAAIDRGTDTSNSIPVRARAVAFALNKIRAADNLANRLFKAPISLEGTSLTLIGSGIDLTLDADGTYTIPGDPDPIETGNWSYARTGARTGVITALPAGGGTHTFNLTFSNPTRGSFTGTTATDESVRGRFTVTPAE